MVEHLNVLTPGKVLIFAHPAKVGFVITNYLLFKDTICFIPPAWLPLVLWEVYFPFNILFLHPFLYIMAFEIWPYVLDGSAHT